MNDTPQEVLPGTSEHRKFESANETLVFLILFAYDITPECLITRGAIGDLELLKSHDASEILVGLMLLANDVSLECRITGGATSCFGTLER
jgi:hypothetical protein